MKAIPKKKIIFLSHRTPLDKRNWSGTMFNMHQEMIKKGYEVEWMSSELFTEKENNWFEKIAKWNEKIFNRTFNRHHTILKAKIISKRIQKLLSKKDFDILFVPAGINEITYLKIKQPIVYLNDILFHQHIQYYPAFTGLGWLSKKTLHYIEKKALDNASAIILPSEWSIEAAQSYYHIPEKKLHLLRFGPNLEVPEKLELTTNHTSEKVTHTLLFLGVDWKRKGGDIAFEAVKILNEKGINAKLKVIGCIPPVQGDFMEVIPFLDKNKSEDLEQLKKEISSSDLLFLPTRAECYGIVFCEASAFGIPSITTATGGVTSIIKDNINGFALPEKASSEEYAEIIEKIIYDPEKMLSLKKSSRDRYENDLTWEKWGKQLDEILKKQ